MSQFHVCKKLKSFFLMILSVVILVCSVPFTSFKSQAIAPTVAAEGLYAMYLALSSYLGTRGYSAPNLTASDGDLIVSESRANTIALRNTLNSFFGKLDEYSPGLGEKFQQDIYNSTKTGRLTTDEETDYLLKSYFASQTVDSRIVLGTTQTTYNSYLSTNGYSSAFTVVNGGVATSYFITINSNVEYLPLCVLSDNNTPSYYIIPRTYQNAWRYSSFNSDYILNLGGTERNGFTEGGWYNQAVGYIDRISAFSNIYYGYTNLSFDNALYFTGGITDAALVNIINYYRTNGYFALDANITSTQITDTSDLDILSSISSVDPITGEVSGGTTLYLPDTLDLEALLDSFANGLTSFYELIKALGLSSVANDATVASKEDALSEVKNPPATYDWLTSTAWGSETIDRSVTDEVASSHAEENVKAGDIAESIGAPDGSNVPEEDKERAGNAMLLATIAMWLGLWHWPDVDPTSPDSGGTDPDDNPFEQGRTADVIAGIGVASSLISDIFNAAGGGSGYGMIFTVGISFVLFSVIIGAGHFLGGLGNHADIQAKQSSTPDRPAQSGKQVAKSGQHRHARIVNKKGA